MRHRRRSYREYDDDDPESLSETLAEVNDRLDDLARQLARIARRANSEDRNIPADRVPASQVPNSLGEALAHFDRRLEQIAAAERAAHPNGTNRDERTGAASNWLPAFDTSAENTRKNLAPEHAIDAEASARVSSTRAPAAPAEPARNLSGLEHQLRNITEQLTALHQPCRIDDAVLALRSDLAEIGRVLNDAMPRHAIDALEKEVHAMAECVDRSRDSSADNAKLAQLERGLADVRDVLLNLKTSENLVEIKEAVKGLAHRIDQVAATNQNPGALQKLDQAVAGLRVIVSHVASNETVGKLADEVRGLSSRFEHAIAESSAKALSSFDRQIAALIDNGRSESTDIKSMVKTLGEQLDQQFTMLGKKGHPISPEIAVLIRTLSEKLDRMQLSEGDKLAGKPDASDVWVERLGAIERSIADVLVYLEEQRRNVPPEPRMEAISGAAMSGEIVARTAGAMVLTPAVITPQLRTQTTADMPVEPSPPSSPAQSPPLETVFTTAPAPDPTPSTASAASKSASPETLIAAASTMMESPRPQVRRPIDPGLPPDTPIEPSPEASQPRASAADRIMASEAALGSAKPAAREVASQFETLIAARRAAFTAGMESTTPSVAPFKPVLDERAEAPKSRLGSYLRWLLFAASVIVIVLGGLRVAMEMWPSSRPSETPSPINDEPSATPPSAAPDAVSGQPAMPMPSPQAAPDQPAEDAPPNPPPGPPSGTPGTVPNLPVDGSSLKTDPPGDARPKPMPEFTGTVSRQDPELNRTAEPALPVTIGGPMLRAAAVEGNPAAQYEIGVRYIDGRGVTANIEEAARWLERAAKAGFAPALFRLGGLYDKGGGLKRDRALARQLYSAAAEKGHAKAMHNLAVLYAEGLDGRPNYRAAAQWFTKAADYGIADSQYNLAILYIRGIGVEQNLAESYKWFALAANQGDQEAAKKRDEVAERLDPQSLNAAQLAVQAFRIAQQPEQAVSLQVPNGGWDRANANVQPARPRIRPPGSDTPTLNLLSPAPF